MVEMHTSNERSVVYKVAAQLAGLSGKGSFQRSFPASIQGQPAEAISICKIAGSDKLDIEINYNAPHGALTASAKLRTTGQLCDDHGLFSIQAMNRLLGKCYADLPRGTAQPVAKSVEM